jgi:hypothetical protein
MEPIKFNGIITEPHVTEDDKIIATWTQLRKGEITLNNAFLNLNNAFFNWDLLKELAELNKNTKDRDRYKGMFKNEN